MIDEQSPASGHDYASNRWAIGAGCGGQRGFMLNITLKSVLDFVNNLQTEKLLKKWIPSNIKHNKDGITKGYSANMSWDMIVSIVDGGHFNLVHTGR